jgi:hypothetical protein
MLGQASISPKQEEAAINPSVIAEDSIKSKQASEENAVPSALPDQEEQSIEPQTPASQDSYRKSVRSRRAAARAPRTRAQNGAVTMMLKPFKAINPLKLRKLRPW